jgi:ABC-type transporter Mla maintaining outer membrane lipid asymmetry ATPase subunit MlaF
VTPILDLAGVTKDYRGLRPLRIERLSVSAGERIALLGLDLVSAEVLLNLVTGATLPDRGEVIVFGRRTADIGDATEWLALVDRFGIVSERAVLLENLTVLQNLALPLTLDIEPLSNETRERALALAREVGVDGTPLDGPVGALDPGAQMRIRLGRALALDPELLLLEHVTAGIPPAEAPALGEAIARIGAARGTAVLALGVDERFARAVGGRVLRWDAASGRLSERRGWFGGRLG